MEDPILDALKRATGYEDIHARPSGYVIRIDQRNRSKIKGLVRNQAGFYLEHNEFDNVPLSFIVEDEPTERTWQYWTLHKRMHREDGPAYIYYDALRGDMSRRYYYFGLGHRANGPFQEVYYDFSIDVNTFHTHFLESWSSAKFEWMIHGDATKQYTRWANLGKGQCYRRKIDRVLDSPEDFGPTFEVDRLTLEFVDWVYVKDKLKDGGVLPHEMHFVDLAENYDKGKLTDRWCEELNATWVSNGQRYAPAFEGEESWISRFNDSVRKNLLKYIDIWNGDVYPDEEAEFLFLTEFNNYHDSK